jgi:cyclase
MHCTELADDVMLFVGSELESASTAIFNGTEALLIDSLASVDDAELLRKSLEARGKRVRMIVCTHFMDDHIAGLRVFSEAVSVAHRHHRATFLSQAERDDAAYVTPTVEIDGPVRFRWGKHQVHVVPNPGKTMDHLTVDIPTADLACLGDNIVGNIVYLSKADPELIDEAILRVQQLGRSRIVGGHMGLLAPSALENARSYLRTLKASVARVQGQHKGEFEAAIANIRVEDCVAAGVAPTPFEREWHQQNLRVIPVQATFAPPA